MFLDPTRYCEACFLKEFLETENCLLNALPYFVIPDSQFITFHKHLTFRCFALDRVTQHSTVFFISEIQAVLLREKTLFNGMTCQQALCRANISVLVTAHWNSKPHNCTKAIFSSKTPFQSTLKPAARKITQRCKGPAKMRYCNCGDAATQTGAPTTPDFVSPLVVVVVQYPL